MSDASFTQPIRRDAPETMFGIFPWWPEDGIDWIHPDDVATARQLVPSTRVLRRERRSGRFAHLFYGETRVRVRPTLWHLVRSEGLEVGDWIEIRSHMGRNLPGLGVIREVRYDRHTSQLYYRIARHGMLLPKHFAAEDLRPAKRLATD